MAGAGHQVGAAQGGFTGGRMVGEQGRHIRHGQKGCDPSPNESDSWSLSPHGDVRTQILAPIAAALDSGRVHRASRPSEGFPPPSLRGRNLVGEIWVVRDRQGGGPIRDLHAMWRPWLKGKSFTPKFDRPASRLCWCPDLRIV